MFFVQEKEGDVVKNLIEGYDELEKKLGYKPNFHDDDIEKVTITKDRIEFELKTLDGVLCRLIFEDVQEINLSGEIWCMAGIIFGLEIEQVDGMLKTIIDSSVGVDGEIISKRIVVR